MSFRCAALTLTLWCLVKIFFSLTLDLVRYSLTGLQKKLRSLFGWRGGLMVSVLDSASSGPGLGCS